VGIRECCRLYVAEVNGNEAAFGKILWKDSFKEAGQSRPALTALLHEKQHQHRHNKVCRDVDIECEAAEFHGNFHYSYPSGDSRKSAVRPNAMAFSRVFIGITIYLSKKRPGMRQTYLMLRGLRRQFPRG
jgi:hypothetical protein